MSDNQNIQVLRDLSDVITTTKTNVRDFTRPAEFGISTAFAGALKVAFPDYSFEFYERTVKVATPGRQYIYVSGQSFALAVCLMDFCEEIGRYRAIAYRVLNRYREELEKLVPGQGRIDDKVFTSLRDNSNKQLLEAFKIKVGEFFASDCDNKEIVARNTGLLMKFLTDYSWWLGGKQISRSNDWCISPISTLLNMPQNDSNFIARVVSKATEDADFREAFKRAIEREWKGDAARGAIAPLRTNEDHFKSWLSTVPKSNGETYSENTRNQYISALKAVSASFAGAIGPFTSVFEIGDIETFDRAVSAIKADSTYEEFNRSRGNGSLSAGLDLYRRFLEERTPNDEVEYLSPAWFRLSAAKYTQVDAESTTLYQQFQSLYSPDRLRNLSDDELLGCIFLGVNDRSLCNALEFDAQYTQFGSIAGGTAYKYNLFYSDPGDS